MTDRDPHHESPEPRRHKREIGWAGREISVEWHDWTFSLDDREMDAFRYGGEVSCEAEFTDGDTSTDPGDFIVYGVVSDGVDTDWDSLTQPQRDAVVREAKRRGAGDCLNE